MGGLTQGGRTLSPAVGHGSHASKALSEVIPFAVNPLFR